MLFMPDIPMFQMEKNFDFTYSRYVIERQNVGQQKDVARPGCYVIGGLIVPGNRRNV